MTFSWISTEREKQIVLRASRLMRGGGSGCYVHTLREDFAGQVFLLRHFSGVAAPVIAGHHADTERSQQG
ncbi:Uncharacterised protein [Escherichia coli]|uniref:Uncharacterized protein n=1 Tax=Escherichia coli TaxID=562 RepID=A0A376NQR8_ECOLX|nr:Uncharacterised protein [Escherichia coli]